MDYYVNIRIFPNIEFSDSILMNEIFSHLHNALVASGQCDIGVSFPNVDKTLGDILRLHGNKPSLEILLAMPWISRLIDYIEVSGITKIPANVNYRIVKRIQAKSSIERLIRRSVQKGWLTEEEAVRRVANGSEKKLSLPYLSIKSLSTGQKFRLFIEHGPVVASPSLGTFNAYGLSSNATIPWF